MTNAEKWVCLPLKLRFKAVEILEEDGIGDRFGVGTNMGIMWVDFLERNKAVGMFVGLGKVNRLGKMGFTLGIVWIIFPGRYYKVLLI